MCKNLGICQIPTLIFDKQEKQKKAQARLDICTHDNMYFHVFLIILCDVSHMRKVPE